jgi:lambda family phage portal protein
MAFGLGFSIRERLGLRKPAAVNPPKRRAYAGANVSRLTADWVSGGSSADSEIKGSLSQLRNRARQLVRDNDYAKRAKVLITNNVVGTGIRLQMQVRIQGTTTFDKTANDAIEAAWEKWTRKTTCDVAGRLNLHQIERMAVGAMVESGEILIRLVPQGFGGGRVPLALQLFESDQLDENYTGGSTVPGNEWRMGVEVDRFGRPVTYAFLPSHPGDTVFGAGNLGARHLLVPANDVIHLYLQERPAQTRGVTMFAAGIQRLHHLAGYEQAALVRARAASALMGFITSPDGAGESYGEQVIDGEHVTTFEPGTFKTLFPGQEVTVPQINAPDGQLEPFVRGMLRAFASGVGVNYAALSGDYSQSNYSSSRLAQIEDRDCWKVLQQYLIDNLLTPIFERWIEVAVLSGAVSLPGYDLAPDRFCDCRWRTRGWSYIDPLKDVEADKALIRCGLKTSAQVVAEHEQGGDIEEIMVALAAERQRAQELGLTLDIDSGKVSNAGLTQARPVGSIIPQDPYMPDDTQVVEGAGEAGVASLNQDEEPNESDP